MAINYNGFIWEDTDDNGFTTTVNNRFHPLVWKRDSFYQATVSVDYHQYKNQHHRIYKYI
jgi:hypothetical protein